MITSSPLNRPPKARKPRAKSPLIVGHLQQTLGQLINQRAKGDNESPVFTATELGRASKPWRKLLSYLREPITSPQHAEASAMLDELGIIHAVGDFNSRTLMESDRSINGKSLITEFLAASSMLGGSLETPIPLNTLARMGAEWAVAHILLAQGESENKDEVVSTMGNFNLTLGFGQITYNPYA